MKEHKETGREEESKKGIDRQTSIRVQGGQGDKFGVGFEGFLGLGKNYKQYDYIAGIWPKFINQWNNLCWFSDMIRDEPTKEQQQRKKKEAKEENENDEKWSEQSLKVKCNEHRGKVAIRRGGQTEGQTKRKKL